MHKLSICLAGLLLVAGCSGKKKSGDDEGGGETPQPAPVAFEWDEAERTAAIEHGTKLIAEQECTRCHEIDEQPGVGRPYDCTSCHVFLKGLKPEMELYQRIAKSNGKEILDRYIANIEHYLEIPSLTKVAQRVRPDWIAGYLKEPHDLRPMLEESMIINQLTDEEIKGLVRYFAAVAEAPDPYAEGYQKPRHPEPATKTALKTGKELFQTRGCPGCHTFGNVDFGVPADTLEKGLETTRLAPNLRYVRDRTRPDVLVDWILDPTTIKPGTKMPKMVNTREEAELIAAYLTHGDPGPLEQPAPEEDLMELPAALDREVTYEEVKEEVLGFVCVHCHMNDHEKDNGPGNKGGLSYEGIGLSFRTYERTVWGAVNADGERYSVLETQPGDEMPRILEVMLRRKVENRRDTVAPFHDTYEVPFGEGALGMPLGLPALSDEKIALVRTWIDQGCPGPSKVSGREGFYDGFLVQDGPIEVNEGCQLREPVQPGPKWTVRQQVAAGKIPELAEKKNEKE